MAGPWRALALAVDSLVGTGSGSGSDVDPGSVTVVSWVRGCLDWGSADVIVSGSVVGARKDGEGAERTSKADNVSEMKTSGGME